MALTEQEIEKIAELLFHLMNLEIILKSRKLNIMVMNYINLKNYLKNMYIMKNMKKLM